MPSPKAGKSVHQAAEFLEYIARRNLDKPAPQCPHANERRNRRQVRCADCGRYLRAVLVLLAVLAGLASAAIAAEPVKLLLEVERVIDGDTLVAHVELPYDLMLRGQRVRPEGYDAWEFRRGRGGVDITDDELLRGAAAKQALEELIERGDVYLEATRGGRRDEFGRLQGRLWVHDREHGWIDVAGHMRRGGHVRR